MNLQPSERVEKLVECYRDGLAEDDQLAQLDALLVSVAGTAECFREALLLEVLLEDRFQQAEAGESLAGAVESWIEIARVVPTRRRSLPLDVPAGPGRRVWRYARDKANTIEGASFLIAGLVISAIVIGLGLIRLPDLIINNRNPAVPQAGEPQLVARIVGTAEARWSPETAAALDGSRLIFAGDPLELLTGLAEIQYDNGVVLIVEAPAYFELTGPGSAALGHGKLLARVTPRGRGFALSVPGVQIVDLGTEFGVQVRELGDGELHVFEGSVRADLRPGTPESERFTLAAGESLAWAAEGSSPRRMPLAETEFAHRLPRSVSVFLPNTGALPSDVRIAAGEPDPRWRVRKANGDKPWQPAAVVGHSAYVESSSGTSNWISIPGDWGSSAYEQVYTFAAEFHLSGVQPDTVRAAVRFAADNRVVAVRLNGHEVPLPQRPEGDEFREETRLNLADFFRDGPNELQVDVLNTGTYRNPMAFRWEWTGRGLRTTGLEEPANE